MEAAVITAVGIDVSKSKSTVAVRRPGGEIVLRPFEVHHTEQIRAQITPQIRLVPKAADGASVIKVQ